MNEKRKALTPAERQRRRRSRLPQRIDYYPSLEALELINSIQHKSGSYVTYAETINSLILRK